MERNHNMVPSSPAARLRQVFRDRTILTMDELKAALDTQVAMTVARPSPAYAWTVGVRPLSNRATADCVVQVSAHPRGQLRLGQARACARL